MLKLADTALILINPSPSNVKNFFTLNLTGIWMYNVNFSLFESNLCFVKVIKFLGEFLMKLNNLMYTLE